MKPEDIVRTKCARCNGTGREPFARLPFEQGPVKTRPCPHCEQTGYIERSIRERCERMLAGSERWEEPAYFARRNAEPMARLAIRLAEAHPWCSIVMGIEMAYQRNEFHECAELRRRKKKLREKWADKMEDRYLRRKWSGKLFGYVPSRRILLNQLAARRNTTALRMWIDAYRSGRMAETVWSLLTLQEQTVALGSLGYTAYGHSQVLGHATIHAGRK